MIGSRFGVIRGGFGGRWVIGCRGRGVIGSWCWVIWGGCRVIGGGVIRGVIGDGKGQSRGQKH